MKKILLLILISIVSINAFAGDFKFDKYFADKNACFILYDLNQNKLIEKYNPKRCAERIAPCSTFKIPLSLMAFDQGIISQKTLFKWDRQDKGLPFWNQDQTPKTWLSNSAVWVSQLLTPKLGLNPIKKYLKEFNYGNQDFTGDPGLNNGLQKAWLESSLKISADEQLIFLKDLADDRLPVSKTAMTSTKENMYLETSSKGWKLYGKTGSGTAPPKDGKLNNHNGELQDGWFVGFITNNNQKYLFVLNLTDLQPPRNNEAGGHKSEIHC